MEVIIASIGIATSSKDQVTDVLAKCASSSMPSQPSLAGLGWSLPLAEQTYLSIVA